jgi:hypothetical protein
MKVGKKIPTIIHFLKSLKLALFFLFMQLITHDYKILNQSYKSKSLIKNLKKESKNKQTFFKVITLKDEEHKKNKLV